MKGSVLVVGGGIAGIQASLDLADSGFKVYLIDQKPSIGGTMPQLDKTFPTNDCAMCILSPKLVNTYRHPNIEIIGNADIIDFSGAPGDFKVKLLKRPRYVDPEKCNGCGECAQSCPVRALDAFNRNLSKKSAISVMYPQAVPLVYSIDRDACIGCGLCEKVCKRKAIDYDQKTSPTELNVGAVILATGAGLFDPSTMKKYGYHYPDVITSAEFERILSASGPYGGVVLRPSDGKRPKNIGFIQCVGSRNPSIGRELCSAVCCMYATKEAIVAKEHDPELDITIFYIDLRAFGKGFEEFTERAMREYGIKYVRCEVPSVSLNKDKSGLTVFYEDPVTNELKSMDLDLLVLSVGLTPPSTLLSLKEIMGLELNDFGYVNTRLTSPVETNISGIYVCGASQGPKDIPDSVAQASAAAAKAEVLLSSARNQLITKKEYPEEKAIPEEPRIGVFVCHCGINIGGIVDVREVVEYVKELPYVVHAERNLYTCSQDTQERIKEVITEKDLNRVIVASCTPRTHESIFRNTCREAGLNQYLFEFCNIREQCSWVHMRDKKSATEKAKDLLRMAVARARFLKPLQTKLVPVKKSALVIGGGISGMTASLDIANQGFEVYLVEKRDRLGGFMRNIEEIQDGTKAIEILEEIIEKVENHPKITVSKKSEVTEVDGFVGNFRAKINTERKVEEVEFGAAIIAVGAEMLEPQGLFHYGESNKIITQKMLEPMITGKWMWDDKRGVKTVVMIQCVGSRDENRPYCSRVCCTEAIKNAIRIKKLNPDTEVYILYRDIRAYGLWEALYREARDLGVVFLSYTNENKPSVDPKNLTVEIYDPMFDSKLRLRPDLIVLSSAIVPRDDYDKLSKMFKVPLDANGFFLEAHVKLRPVDFATDGVFVCGTAHSPKMIYESIAQASAAASHACTILSKDSIESEGAIGVVDEEKCKGCGICVEVCPFKAIELQPEEMILEKVKFLTRKAYINPITCKGCGSCAVECPVGAITPQHFSKQQIEASLEAAIIKSKEPVDFLPIPMVVKTQKRSDS